MTKADPLIPSESRLLEASQDVQVPMSSFSIRRRRIL
jgi:hypothetical protein